MSGDSRLPVQVLSGFLGSGKTTLLKRWLQGQVLSDVALLVNEFGEVGIDHLLLNEVAPDTVLLPGGCVCCQIRGELKQALLDLWDRRERGELPPFSQVILETTGLADPAPILSTLLHDRQLQYHFKQGALVTLVDAEHGLSEGQRHPEWLAQVTAADRLLISKRDRVSAPQAEALAERLRQLNPLAELLPAGAELADLFRLSYAHGSASQRFRWLGAAPAVTAAGAAAKSGDSRTGGDPQPHLQHPLTETCVITLQDKNKLAGFCRLAVDAVTLPRGQHFTHERHSAGQRKPDAGGDPRRAAQPAPAGAP